jgi:hypothetical protein
MTKYIEYFQVEAKCLLKDFKKNLPEAKSRCEKYFSGKSELSLMNTQHVIAKEYGFNSWNDLIKQEPHKLAEALIVTKNKTLKNPFKLWWGGRITTGYEQNIYPLHKPEDYQLEYDAKKKAFYRGSISNQGDWTEYLSFEHLDISEYDLSGVDPLKIRYSEDTKWPEDKSMLPVGFNPREFLEIRKNPGLGIRTLHKQGIKGQGSCIAIIGGSRLFNHIEYHNSLKGYEEIGFNPTDYGGGADGRIVSLLIGKSCGIAPLSEAYFYAVNTRECVYSNYAIAIQKICELHKKLKDDGKSGIDIVFIGRSLSNENDQGKEGFDDCQQALKELKNLKIYTEKEFYNHYDNSDKFDSARIFCRVGGDIDNPNDYEITDQNFVKSAIEHAVKLLFFPSGAKTVALDVKMDGYAFDHKASSHIGTYPVGLYLLAKSVKENITPLEFFELGIKTGTFKEGVGTIINPVALIESLK